MFQKQYSVNVFDRPYQKNDQFGKQENRMISHSPKVQYLSPRKKVVLKELDPRKKTKSNYNNNKIMSSAAGEKSFKNYSQYYEQIISITNSGSVGPSHPSKCSRTQISKSKLKRTNEMQSQECKIKGVKEYCQASEMGSSEISKNRLSQDSVSRTCNNLQINGDNKIAEHNPNDKKMIKSKSRNCGQLRTQYSQQRGPKLCSKDRRQVSSSNHHPVQTSNSNNNDTRTRYANHSGNQRKQQARTSRQHVISPSQQYYSTNQEQSTRQHLTANSIHPGHTSNNASTLNTQNRPSASSLDRFATKPMLTFYHCEMKKFYKYNDQGYLTDRQIALRQKVQRGAQNVVNRMINQMKKQSQTSKFQKSKSVGHFPKLNKLKQQAQKQRKRKHEQYGKCQYQESIEEESRRTLQPKQISLNPSQLPPTSSLSKKKFKIIYKQDQNQNLLTKNHINDDSYHDRVAHIKQRQIKGKPRQSLTSKNKGRESPISKNQPSKQQHDFDSSQLQSQDSESRNLSANQLTPRAITSDQILRSRKQIHKGIILSKKHNPNSVLQASVPSSSDRSGQDNLCELSQNSKNNEQSVKAKSIGSLRNSSLKSDNLQMINSNYKRVKLSQEQLDNLVNEQSQSLKLKTNTQKANKINNKNTQKLKINHQSRSITSQEDFNQDDQFSQKQTSNSVKSIHYGLKKQSSKSNRQINSKLSNHGSQSVIQPPEKRNSCLKKWVRQDSNTHQQISRGGGQINMKKNKQKVGVIQTVTNSKQITQIKDLQLDSTHKIERIHKISIQSDCLRIQSAVRSHNKTKDLFSRPGGSKIQQKSERNESQVIKSVKNSMYESQPGSLMHQSKRDSLMNQSQPGSLMQQSRHSGALMGKSQARAKYYVKKGPKKQKSDIINSRGTQQGKAGRRRSRKRSSVKISLLRSVDANRSKRYSNAQSCSHLKVDSQKLQQDYIVQMNQVAGSGEIKKSSGQAQNNREVQSSDSNTFNLIDRVQELMDIEDQLHDKRKAQENQDRITEQLNEVLAKIQAHIYTIRQILEISTSAMDIYSQDSAWVFKSCLLSLKKYHLERVKMVNSLRGKKSCFKMAQNQLAQEDLNQYLDNQEIVQLAKDLNYCNQLTNKVIEHFLQYLKRHMEQCPEGQFNLRPFDDRFELGTLLEQYRTEILGLREKTAPIRQHPNGQQQGSAVQSASQQEALQQQAQQVINKRIFKLMEAGFLLSQLAGKRIKQFNQQIDIEQEFQDYFEDYWPHFERIAKTFA